VILRPRLFFLACESLGLIIDEIAFFSYRFWTCRSLFAANQVGQVNCNNCKLLLMYPYGAPAVRCSSCNSVTDISVCIHRWFCAPCPNHTWKSWYIL